MYRFPLHILDFDLTCALFSRGKTFPSGPPRPLIWTATVAAKSSQMPNLYLALIELGGGEAKPAGGGGRGGEGTSDTRQGHSSTGEINTKESLYVVLAEALQGVVRLKKSLPCFGKAPYTVWKTLILGTLRTCLIKEQSLPYENGATEPSS